MLKETLKLVKSLHLSPPTPTPSCAPLSRLAWGNNRKMSVRVRGGGVGGGGGGWLSHLDESYAVCGQLWEGWIWRGRLGCGGQSGIVEVLHVT